MEKDGVHFHFTDKSIMDKEIKDGKFLEFAYVLGTSVEAVEMVSDVGKVSSLYTQDMILFRKFFELLACLYLLICANESSSLKTLRLLLPFFS